MLPGLFGLEFRMKLCGIAFSSQNLVVTCQKPRHSPQELCRFEWSQWEEDPQRNRESLHNLDDIEDCDECYEDYDEYYDGYGY